MQVTLNVYDLSMGISRQYSSLLAGKHFEAVYHTGVAVDGTEYYYGDGVDSSPAGQTPYGTPIESIDMGKTERTREEVAAFLEDSKEEFSGARYNVISHNCNHFSNAFLGFLVGGSVPDRIVNQGMEFLQTPLGRMMAPMLQYGPGAGPQPAAQPGARPAARPAPHAGSPPAGSPSGAGDPEARKYPGITLDEPKAYLNKQPTLQNEAACLTMDLVHVLGLGPAMEAIESFGSLVDAVCEKRDFAVSGEFVVGLGVLLHLQLDDHTSLTDKEAKVALSCIDLLSCVCLTSSVVYIPVPAQPYYCVLNYSTLPSPECKEAVFRYLNNWVIQIPGMKDLRQRATQYLEFIGEGVRDPQRGVRLAACRALYNASRALTAADVEENFQTLREFVYPIIVAAAGADEQDRKALAAPANLVCGALGRCLLTAGTKGEAFREAQRSLRDVDFSALAGPCARDLKVFLRLTEAVSGDDELF